MGFQFCTPVKWYVFVIIVLIVLGCIINIVTDYYNSVAITYTLTKNTLISICTSIYCFFIVLAFMYICSCPRGERVVWVALLLGFLSCISGLFSNFFYVYYWNPV